MLNGVQELVPGDSLAAKALAQPESSSAMFTELFEHAHDAHELQLPFLGTIDLPRFAPLHVAGLTIDLSITKHVVFLWIAALLLFLVARAAARKSGSARLPGGVRNLIEVFLEFVRDDIVLPNMGPGGIRYIPYLITTFLFILIMNVMGIIPYGSTATSNINVTAGLAIIAFFMIQIAAIRSQGLGHYLAHLTGGVHWALWPIMIPIEILGLFTKPFALCIRLFANMTGGHLVIISLIGLIFLFKSYIIAPIPVAFAVGINLLELLVAVLQAYIFTMLTALFMGLGIQAGHGEQEHSQKGH
ncbi:MAG TPA: F0F1 ATP synthase subunit A [Bacteroidota bacterium]|nr:F0F1 ATP synthase subunit A [Bacteroidota bacterium]